MAKYTTERDIKALGLARLAKPNASDAQHQALADAIVALNGVQKGHVFPAGTVVRLGEGISISGGGSKPAPEAPPALELPEEFLPEPVYEQPVFEMPAPIYNINIPEAKEAPPWTLEGDPVYQAAMAQGSSQFNLARAKALADTQNAQTEAVGARRNLDTTAQENRRRLAGNFAARNMAGGSAGALAQSEARLNAEQIAQRTSITDQIDALNRNYLATFGATGTDWTGTQFGQNYKTEAAQAAINAQLGRYGRV